MAVWKLCGAGWWGHVTIIMSKIKLDGRLNLGVAGVKRLVPRSPKTVFGTTQVKEIPFQIT